MPPYHREKKRLPFSMKDLCLSASVLDMVQAGVHCLKIEGRMKGALYVATVTDFYRKLLDGAFRSEDEVVRAEEDLRTVFSRPWTNLYFENPKNKNVVDPEMSGNRGVPVGTIERIVEDLDGGRWVEFRTERDLELHDGLQLDMPTDTGRPYGFSIRRFAPMPSEGDRPIFTRRAGMRIRVEIPDDAPHFEKGTLLCCTSSQAVKRRYDLSLPNAMERRQRFPVAVSVEVKPTAVNVTAWVVRDVPSRLASQGCDALPLASVSGTYAPAKEAARMDTVIREAFEKLGETDFQLSQLEIRNEQGLFVPMSHLNQVRREMCDTLTVQRENCFADSIEKARNTTKSYGSYRASKSYEINPPKEHWTLYADSASTLRDLSLAHSPAPDEILLSLQDISDTDIAHIASSFGQDRIRLALPTIVRAWESVSLQQRLEAFHAKGFSKFSISNLAGFDFVRPLGNVSLIADWQLNSLNGFAIEEWLRLGCERVTLSPEDTFDNMADIARHCPDAVTIVLYQDVSLMISEVCPRHVFTECAKGKCDAPMNLLSERDGSVFHVRSDACRTTLFGDTPRDSTRHLDAFRAMGIRHFRLDFALRSYTPEDVAKRCAAVF